MTDSQLLSSLSERANRMTAQQLQPIYSKVRQLREQHEIRQNLKMQKMRILYNKNIIFCHEVNIIPHSNRGQSISRKRSIQSANFQPILTQRKILRLGSSTKFNKITSTVAKKQRVFSMEALKMKPRPQRLKYFLVNNKNPEKQVKTPKLQQKQNRSKSAISRSVKHPGIPQEQAKLIQQQIRDFSPIRPASRMSGTSSSLADKKLSSSSNQGTLSRQNSFRTSSRNTIGMVSNFNSNKSYGKAAPAKYLRKGTRIREALLKQLNVADFDNDQQLTYLKDYDQWVPASLATMRRQQLQKYMQILVGKKKQDLETNRIDKFEMIYL